MFPHPGFIDSVTALGNFEWRISIQGATDEAHVATTGRADSFQRIVHGLGELQRRGQLVTTNMCVNERSYRSLPHYPELLERYGVRQLHVDIVRPESTGERDEAYLRDIMPRYSDMAPYYAEMLAGLRSTGIPTSTSTSATCRTASFPTGRSRIHHGGQQTVTKSSDGHRARGRDEQVRVADVAAHPSAGLRRLRLPLALHRHLPRLPRAARRRRVPAPQPRRSCLGVDPQQRSFVILVEPLLAPLRAALAAGEQPPAWRLRAARSPRIAGAGSRSASRTTPVATRVSPSRHPDSGPRR